MVKKIYTHKKVQEALREMEARDPSLSLLVEEHSKYALGEIDTHVVRTDYMTNQPVYSIGIEELDIMKLLQVYSEMEPDKEERKYEAMLRVVLKQQKQK